MTCLAERIWAAPRDSDDLDSVDDHGGTFRTHLELASLAVALKRRVVVLQAVEHAQSDPGNPFENFTRALKRDQQRLDELESGIAGVLVRLSALELARPNGLRPVFTPGEVDRLLRATHRIHQLGDGVAVNCRTTEVAIEIVRDRDGSVVVFPTLPAEAWARLHPPAASDLRHHRLFCVSGGDTAGACQNVSNRREVKAF